MSNSSQYAVTAKQGYGLAVTADASRTAPTIAPYVYPSGLTGSRIDHINMVGVGATIASVVRLFLVPGFVGGTIASITFSTTTATVTTSVSHGLSTGAKIVVQNALPFNYNVQDVAITVTGLTTFTYTMSAAPTVNATSVGYYIYTTATPTFELWSETLVTAITPSTTVATFTANLSSAANTSQMPLWLPAGWSLRCSMNDTQAGGGVGVFANGGDF